MIRIIKNRLNRLKGARLVMVDGHPIGLLDLIKTGLATPMRVRERGYVRDTAYRRAAIMWSFVYSPHFVFWYASEEVDEDFFAAAERKEFGAIEGIVDSFNGVAISEYDLSIPPRELINNPTAETFVRLWKGGNAEMSSSAL